MKTIAVGSNTKQAHEKFISWLNGLLNQYVSSFYDVAIQNILTVAFIKRHKCFIQELYLNGGKQYVGFMTVLPTNTTDYILMIHQPDGVPYLYNKTEGSKLFNFNSQGILTNFFEDITIPIYNEDGTSDKECFISFRELYGIKIPFYTIKFTGTNNLIGEGFVDFNYEGKFSGTYMADTAPMDEVSYFEVTTDSVTTIVLNVPILKDFELQYEFKPNQTVLIPYTDTTEYFLRQMKELGTIRYKLINP